MLQKYTRMKLHREISPEARARACQRIINPSQPSFSFYLMVCLSSIIATFGLLSNSTAVVIGAMLVAPLMSPIFGIALALTTGNGRLLRTASRAEIAGIILAVSLPVLIGMIPLRPEFGSEIMARTQPTIYDILIALAAGLAGAYALVDEKISPALPGVAIATALVPPLASCGLNIAAGNGLLAQGAFMLFLVNFIAIEFAAALVFMLSGLVELPTVGNGSRIGAMVNKLGVSFTILLVATVFMTQTLVTMVEERQLDKDIRSVLSSQLSTYAGARLSNIRFDENAEGLQVIAEVITPQEFDSTRVADLEKALEEVINPNTYLIVRSMVSRDADRSGPVFISSEELNQRYQSSLENEYMNRVSLVIRQQTAGISGGQVTDVAKEVQEGIVLITASIRAPRTITPTEVNNIEQQLQQQVDGSIKLVVRSIITREADASHYLYTSVIPSELLEGQDLDLYNRLFNEISWYSSQLFEGSSLEQLNIQPREYGLKVYAVLQCPVTINPAMVTAMQAHLRTHIHPDIDLTVRTEVGATATANGFTSNSE